MSAPKLVLDSEQRNRVSEMAAMHNSVMWLVDVKLEI